MIKAVNEALPQLFVGATKCQKFTHSALPYKLCGNMNMDKFLKAAIEEAQKGMTSGGIPIGSVLVIDGQIVGRGHNQRVQKGSAILHAEMHCLENAGRLKASDYRRATLYSTLSPCDMCSGAVLLYGITKVIIGENRTFCGPEDYVKSRGVEVIVVDNQECRKLMAAFIKNNPGLWREDIGE
jgi:cytosine/creatinine deaminase